jgi:hypothetical protein
MILRTRQRSRPGNRAVQCLPRAGSELTHRTYQDFRITHSLRLFLHLYSLTRGRRNTHIHSLQGISEHSHLLQRRFQPETVFHVLPDKPRRWSLMDCRVGQGGGEEPRGQVMRSLAHLAHLLHLPSAICQMREWESRSNKRPSGDDEECCVSRTWLHKLAV